MLELSSAEIAEALQTSIKKNFTIKSICTDTRKITPDCLFVGIKGENFDGHEFIDYALRNGAVAALSERESDKGRENIIYVESTLNALVYLAGHYRSKFQIPFVGVTGSVGKTTTKDMIHSVLSKKYNTLKNQGNLNNEIGLPQTIFSLSDRHQAAVIEMGMIKANEITLLSKAVRPCIGVVTRIGVSHIENLGSRDNIFKAKMEIIDGMDNDAVLILNKDDEYLASYSSPKGHKIYFYGIENDNADIIARDIFFANESTSFVIDYNCFGKSGSINAKINAIGKHSVSDALAAFACGLGLDISPEDAVSGLLDYSPSGLRQKIVVKNSVTIIEDCYNASPDSMKAALKVLADIAPGRKIAVLGDMLELGIFSDASHLEIGEYVSHYGIDILLAYGEKSALIVEGAKIGTKTIATHYKSKELLTNVLFNILRPGDTVLFKASRGIQLESCFNDLYKLWDNAENKN